MNFTDSFDLEGVFLVEGLMSWKIRKYHASIKSKTETRMQDYRSHVCMVYKAEVGKRSQILHETEQITHCLYPLDRHLRRLPYQRWFGVKSKNSTLDV